MKKNLTNLIACAALMLLACGTAVGQTYWGFGCDCNGGTYDVDDSFSYDDGLNINGNRYTYYFEYPVPASGRPTFGGHNTSSPYPSANTTLYWDSSDNLMVIQWHWTGGCTNEYPLGTCIAWNWTLQIDREEHVSYPTNLYPSQYHCKSGYVKRTDGHLTQNPTHTHGIITVNVNSVAACGSTHFGWLYWGSPTWGHYGYTYDPLTFDWISNSSNDGQHALTNNEGHFILTNNVNMRLKGSPQFRTSPSNIPLDKQYLKFGSGYSIRFDQTFSGTSTAVVSGQQSHLAADIGTGNTIGLWEGTLFPLTFVNGGTLLLGPKGDDQDLIFLKPGGGTISVKNYFCCSSSDTDPLWEHHGIHFNVGGITNTSASQINIENECIVACGTNDIAVYNDNAWLILDGDQLPNLWKGNVLASAWGHVRIDTIVTANTDAKTHEIRSHNNALTFMNNFSVTNSHDEAHEYYHVDGDCCESYISAGGTQSYTFTGIGGKLDMVTATGTIEMAETFNFAGKGNNNKLNMLGDGGIKIDGADTVKTIDEGHARFYSESGPIWMGSTLEHLQEGTVNGDKGLTLWANGDVYCPPYPLVCMPGGYVRVDGSISSTNTGFGLDTIRSFKDSVNLNSGIAYSGENGKLWIDGHLSVNIKGKHDGTNPDLPTGIVLGAARGGNEGVYIHRTGAGSDSIHSKGGHIYVSDPFTYWQNLLLTGSSNGLTLFAEGACDAVTCDNPSIPIHGYIALDSSVTTKNSDEGYVLIKSLNDHVTLGHGMVHEGINGNLDIFGNKYVDIKDGYNSGKEQSTNPDITLPAVLDSIGLYIYRNGTGNDNIISDAGHIYIYKSLTYDQAVAANGGSGLTVNAQGDCVTAVDCYGQVGGFVKIDSAVTTTNIGNGFTVIKSDNHYVEMNGGFVHTGVDSSLLVSGKTKVDINNAYPADYFHSAISSAIPVPGISGQREGVYILRTGTGSDTIISSGGHVNVTDPFFYEQKQNVSTTSGLAILAEGACEVVLPCGELGYVWLQNDVWTKNVSEGPTTIQSNNHYVRIGEDSRNPDHTGARFTHLGVSGNLNILAKGESGACGPICDNIEWTLWEHYNNIPHSGRSYVWIGNDVKITMDGTNGTGIDGNAVIRSYNDVVNMDDSVTFTDANGANFLVDGEYGIRTLGPTALTNNKYTPSPANGLTIGTTSGYATAGQGFVTYLSQSGYVDFGKAPDISDEANFNTPFLYTAGESENALLIEGDFRVFFGDSTTITMGRSTSPSTVFGNAKIYSPEGWIKFADTLGYTGTEGNLIIYANGTNASTRSDLLQTLGCIDHAGFILFDSITKISYPNQLDMGITWIHSSNDDVVIGDMFTYESGEPASHPYENGEFIMQAGQDIYGKSFDDTIHFIQRGDSSILLEAQKTIRLQQMLYIDREKALQGDITFKAGYPTFAEPADAMAPHEASFRDYMPSAMLIKDNATGYWNPGDCGTHDYINRYEGHDTGSDIWFEGRVWLDLTQSTKPNNNIKTTFRAFNSIFIDSTFVYEQYVSEGGDILLFAETGNIEAAVTRQDASEFPTTGYIADDTVRFDIQNIDFNKEIRIQAGNQVWDGDEDDQPTNLLTCWKKGDVVGAEYNGNILYNKPFIMDNRGKGYTILSAARDIETQVMAPFIFTYNGGHQASGDLDVTAGRHIETHAMMQFNYPDDENQANVTLEAGRLDTTDMIASNALCKTIEEGTTLADINGDAFNPDVRTGGKPDGNPAINNEFAAGGKGHGSILLFDSLEFNYDGAGTVLLVAENGNIESDPYLHKTPGGPANPGQGGNTGNWGNGYNTLSSLDPIQHDAQLTFNHGGSGITQLKAIDIKLHDKISYLATQQANKKNGQFYITAYDSVLTRNLQYENHTDTGSVFITTAKYKSTLCDVVEYDCALGGPGIHQGHIVLGYGADCDNENMNDSIIFDYNRLGTNNATTGGNIHILAGFEGFERNRITGKPNSTELFKDDKTGMDKDKGKGYGGNITFDYTEFYMPTGSGTTGGFTEIRTPNGNIWGKDSILYRGVNGDFLVDAGQGSTDDLRAIRWRSMEGALCIGGSEDILNTDIKDNCGDTALWRTGNIMMKGATLNFGKPSTTAVGTGNAIFRTREGFIDTYDAFTVDSMAGNLLKYAGMENTIERRKNNWGDVSERDFRYTPVKESGSVFFGADDNVMLNYGNSNLDYWNYGDKTTGSPGNPGNYDITGFRGHKLNNVNNPYYYTSYEGYIEDLCYATFNVNVDGYMFYRNDYNPRRNLHLLYRGCEGSDCSGLTGDCKTTSNGARDLAFNFDEDIQGAKVQSGGLAVVASNYIDLFTKFTYRGGEGSGLGAVPGMNNLHGESVSGYGLYIKSQYNGEGNNHPEKRRATCENCDGTSSWPIGGGTSIAIPEMTYIGFHDDARIHTNNQKSLLEAPVIEFFGHAELDSETEKGSKTKITLKGDSLIFHDSVIFDGTSIDLTPFTTDATQRANDMRYGVINDRGNTANYSFYGPAIEMEDRVLPVIELGYQRCTEPGTAPNLAPNVRSMNGKERTPAVGGDVIVAFKHGYSMPIFNSVVANNARISFISDSLDGVTGGEYIDAFIRTDLLRIRNKVEFYTDPQQPINRSGKFVMATPAQMDDQMVDPGMYTRHLHTEPGSELSIPGEDSLIVVATTVVGGYGEIHENVFVKANATLAPGFASLMEGDCQTPYHQGKLTIHNLQMEKDAVLRISINYATCVQENGEVVSCMQTDLLEVQDTVFFTEGKVPLTVLPETETLLPGCYLFMTYGDSLGVSREYVKNFVLTTQRYKDSYYTLDFSEAGKVYLCVTEFPIPEVQRYVDLPAVEGVTTVPGPRRHYVKGNKNFTFTATFTGAPLKVTATGFYSGWILDLDNTAKILGNNYYEYTIYQVVEPWTVYIGPDASTVSNEFVTGKQRVWAYRNTLYINSEKSDVVSIYNITGVLNKKMEIPEGVSKFTLERGAYVVTLKDGSIHKIIIR
ncbi:MAG: hypothetical protein LBL33_07990 [Tannerella sp.]|nr:hypothetical protein [Tannerella sp.]